MSFLSHLFPGHARYDQDYDEEEWDKDYDGEEDEENIANILSQLRAGTTLDIITQDDVLLLTGKITSLSTDTLKLERLPGCLSFPTINVGEAVSIRSYNTKIENFRLSGIIQESTRTACCLKKLKAEKISNQRLSFRVVLSTPASLYHQDDEKLLHPEECTLVNISTGGACVESEYIHHIEEVLYLKVKLQDYQPMKFLGQIIRSVEYNTGLYRYGILFAQLPESELTSFTKVLYNLQTGNTRSWGRSQEGSWI